MQVALTFAVNRASQGRKVSLPEGGEAVAVVGTGGVRVAVVAGGDTVETRNEVKLTNIRP